MIDTSASICTPVVSVEFVVTVSPAAPITVPPTIVPPASLQGAAVDEVSSVVLFSVPVRLITLAPSALNVPRSPSENVPPRFSVELVTVIVPPFV